MIFVQKVIKPITVQQKSVLVQKVVKKICVTTENPPIERNPVRSFIFTATQGQTIFNLPSNPKTNGVFMLSINGITQSQARPDFSLSGATITLTAGVDAGDSVFGFYEET